MSKTSFPNDDPHDDQKPKLEDYTLGETLGRGTFGKVKLGTHKITSQKVAIKILEKSKLGDPDFQKRVNREIKILKDFCHPNVINIYQVIETQNEFYMIMEYINGGELSDYIAAKKKLNEDEACRIFRQIISAIEDLHKNGIAHRDLKPENILLDSDRNVKIIDFGLSNTYKPGEMLKTACGSPCYAAPEMIAGKPYHGLETDIWSCGITLFLMICGQLPFDDKNTSRLYKKILEDDLAISKLVSPEARDLLKNVLNKDPVKRFTVKQIVEHAWYKGQKFPPQLQQSTSNEVIIRNLEDYGVEVNEAKDGAKENKVTRLSNLYHLLHQTQLKKGEKPEKAKNAHNSLVTTTKKIEDESSPYANIMKANSIALRSRAMDSVKTPKGSEQIHERMNSLDRSIASDKNKAGPYTSLEKIIEKEKVSIKSPRVVQQETSGRADISQQKMQLKTSFLSQINDFKDAINLVSTRATSNTSDDTKRPKTERERKNITYFPLAKTQSQKEKSSVNDKSLTNCGKPESIDSDRGRTPIVVVGADNINLSYRALSNEKNGEASSLNSISNSNDLNEDIKNPYGLFKPGSLKEASSPQSATHKNTKSNAMYNSMRNALKSNYITSLVTNKKIDVPNPVKEARSKERLTIESILPDTGSPVGNKPIRSFLKQSQNSTINDVKRLINNSFGPKVLGPEEPHSTNYQTVLDVPKPSLEIIPVTTTVKRNSKHQNLLTWKQFDSKITQRQNQSLLVSAKENSTKKSDQNTTLTSIIKQLPEELSGVQTMKESRRRNNTPTKVGDISLSDKFKGTALWPSPSVVPCDEEQQTRLYNKFRKHMINM